MNETRPTSTQTVLIPMANLSEGGIARIVLLLAGGLARRGYRVVLLVHDAPNDRETVVPQGVRIFFGGSVAYKRTHLPRLALTTLRFAIDADVIVAAEEGRAGILALLAGKLLRRPVIAWIHCDWREFGRYVSWRTRLGLRLYRFASRVVAVSQGALDGLASYVQLRPERAKYILNAIRVDEVALHAAEPLPAEFTSEFEGPTIVAVGRLDPQKGFDVLVRALAILHGDGHVGRLVLVGRGGERESLDALALSLGVSQSVCFAGYQTNPFPFMAQATVVAMPSRFEGFGLALVEALATRTAVVATDCRSGPREILDDGRYGLLVPVDNPAALAKALAQVLDDAKLREDLRGKARGRAEVFGEIRFLDEWDELIHECLTLRNKNKTASKNLSGP